MTYEMLQNVHIIAGITSLVMAGVSVALFFLLRIPDVFGYLTGRTRRKGVDEIREQSGSGDRKKSAEKKPGKKSAGKGGKKATAGRAHAPAITAKMPPAPVSAETVPLEQPGMTAVLEGGENLTTVLPDAGSMQTTVLEENAVPVCVPEFSQQPFEIEFEITYIHTNEVID